MRWVPVIAVVLALPLAAQVPASKLPPAMAVAPAAETQAALVAALAGDWTGVLAYRDYAEPASSTLRVELPTWLHIAPDRANASRLRWYFLYDDGPNKVVDETLFATPDVAASAYTITNDHGRTETYKVAGYSALAGGRGSFVLLGPGTDNNRPVETRLTITVRRNLLQLVEENRATGESPFVFRHSYTFTRAVAPAVTPPAGPGAGGEAAGPGTGAGTAGSGTAGPGTAGTGTAGTGTAGSGAAGRTAPR